MVSLSLSLSFCPSPHLSKQKKRKKKKKVFKSLRNQSRRGKEDRKTGPRYGAKEWRRQGMRPGKRAPSLETGRIRNLNKAAKRESLGKGRTQNRSGLEKEMTTFLGPGAGRGR